MKLLKHISPVLILLLLGSCDIINPEEKIASYIYLESIEVVDNPLVAEGGLEDAITNAQVYVGGEYLGIFTLPSLVPVLNEGSLDLVVDPVVKQNGQTFSLNVYPFYKRMTQTVDLVAGKTDTVNLETSYLDEMEIGFIEDFEVGGNIFTVDRDGNEGTFVDVTTEEVFEGDRSGYILLDTSNVLIDVSTDENSLFPLGGAAPIWLEITIKTEVNVLIGLVGYQGGSTGSSFEFGVRANDEWRKIYYNLESEVVLSGFDEYGIALTAGLPFQDGAFTQDSAKIYIDNVKLLYQKQ
ncbi:MAG: hypothetical protein GYB31_10955 [Bacteroidetes bacterium]|nr:hypothetical protein [Bacteroidota bacterium]